jgi:hypothetical protein
MMKLSLFLFIGTALGSLVTYIVVTERHSYNSFQEEQSDRAYLSDMLLEGNFSDAHAFNSILKRLDEEHYCQAKQLAAIALEGKISLVKLTSSKYTESEYLTEASALVKKHYPAEEGYICQ